MCRKELLLFLRPRNGAGLDDDARDDRLVHFVVSCDAYGHSLARDVGDDEIPVALLVAEI